jgi:prophage antirepressor-like protein
MEIFKYQGENITTYNVNEMALFRAKEIAEILGYKNTKQAIIKHVDKEDIFEWGEIKKMDKVTSSLEISPLDKTCQKYTKFINESGVYSLILRSNKPEAKAFKRWVTSEVLPSIRKTGKYEMTPERKLELIKGSITALKDIGDLEERDKIFLKGEIRNNLLGTSEPSNKRREVPITDRINQLGYRYKPSDRSRLVQIGTEVSKKYQDVHGEKPHKREQYVDGATRLVSCYTEKDFPLIDPIIKKYYGRN